MQELPPGFRVVGAPQGGDPVIAPPNPYKEREASRQDRVAERQDRVADRGDAQFQYQMLRDQAEDAEKAKEADEKARIAKSAQDDAAYNLMRVISKIDSIKADSRDSWTGVPGLGETGFLGAMQGNIPGTPALGLRNDIKTVDAQQVLQAMTRLKELSPTGSTGFGALSAPELELLRSSVANINADNDQGTFEDNLGSARKVYRDMLMRIDPSLVERVDKGEYDLPPEYGALPGEGISFTVTDEGKARPGESGYKPASLPADIDGIMRKYGINK